MKIQECATYKYSLPLRKPLYVAGKEVKNREGLILRLRSEDGHEGFGDIAPLPHVNKETLEQALAQVQPLRRGIIDRPVPPDVVQLKGGFKKWLGRNGLASSVEFGVELAVLNLLADRKKMSLGKLLDDALYEKVQVNGLLHGSKEEVKQQAQELIAQGFHSLKLKVGKNVEEEIVKVIALNEVIAGHAILHLDANQSWTIAQAVHFGHEVGLATVDYIEEPFPDLNEIPNFFMKTTIPVAVDETLFTTPIADLKSIDGLEVAILKPTRLGGIEKSVQLIKEAQRYGISTVLSSCYESSIGILGLANLAGVSSRHQGAGLDTLKFFKEDVLKKPIAIEHGKIDISTRRIHAEDINFNVLTEIP